MTDKHKKYQQNQRDRGLVLIKVYVPEDDREKALKYCARLRKQHADAA